MGKGKYLDGFVLGSELFEVWATKKSLILGRVSSFFFVLLEERPIFNI